MDDFDAELPDYDDVAIMVSVDDIDKKEAADHDIGIQSLPRAPKNKNTKDGPKQTETNEPPLSASRRLAINKLMSMGYNNDTASSALNAINAYAPNNTHMAVEWIMDHPEANTTPDITPMDGPKSTTTNPTTSTQMSRMQPMEVEDGNNNNNDTNTNNNNNNVQPGPGTDYAEKCTDCMMATKIFCVDCCGNGRDKYDNMSRDERRIFWGFWGALCAFGVLLAIILIPVSIRRVEFDEYAIKYDGLTREEDSVEYGEGRYVFTPATKLFIYDSLIQKLSLSLDCLTQDGIVMLIEVDIQYSIPQTSVYDIWEEFGKEAQIDKYFALVSADAVRDAIGSFPASAFYRNRFGIQIAIEDALIEAAHEEARTHLLMNSAVLAGYTYPDILKEVIKTKRAAENEIEVAKNQRDGNLTDAETNYLVAKVNAERIRIQGEAEVESLLNEANAHASAVEARFEHIQELFETQARRTNFTGKQFVDYWLTAFVLLEANKPITTTLSDDEYYIPPKPIYTPAPTDADSNITATSVTPAPVAEATQYFTSTAP